MGLGAMGSGIAKMVLSKKRMEIVGAIDTDPNKVGKDLNEILGTNFKPVACGVLSEKYPGEALKLIKNSFGI
ncbi:hypothetical protein TKV_c11550 [Thermoanaerobacter kivui]|uniref:Uncharacterized protein n=1 Tax=Thermoanaerobacter kivui TaxID=2325 RepID=A0A097AR91_THEKI|nr:hypothetical protein [Thermoanaerobacter kivui]AIS52327.1 hypothetical protein TKV_c11550 [Thermoanaerobacter kivui]